MKAYENGHTCKDLDVAVNEYKSRKRVFNIHHSMYTFLITHYYANFKCVSYYCIDGIFCKCGGFEKTVFIDR